MKNLALLLVLLLASEYKFCNDYDQPIEAKDCNNQTSSGSYYRCCFEKIVLSSKKKKTFKFCVGVNQNDYETIKRYSKYRKELREDEYGELDDYEIDCSSKYFYISTIYLFIALLFLN